MDLPWQDRAEDDINDTPFWRVVDGILQEMVQHLSQATPVSLDERLLMGESTSSILEMQLEGDSIRCVIGDTLLSHKNGFPYQAYHIKGGAGDLESTGF